MIILNFKDMSLMGGAPKVAFSCISPPIYVDSRLAAREKKTGKPANPVQTGNINSQDVAGELFDPSLIIKELTKKVKGKGKKEEETRIENSLKGLFDYLTAPNIKNKTKSILFFFIRFTKCVKIYLPSELAESAGVNNIINLENGRATNNTRSGNWKARKTNLYVYSK